jgi:hypothetical protein
VGWPLRLPYVHHRASAIEQQGIDYQTLRAFGHNRLRYRNVGDDLAGQIKFMF